MKLRDLLRETVRSLVDDPSVPEVSDEELDAASVAAAERGRLEERLRTVERINGEYFAVIESIERERDEWKRMLFEQSGEHQNAQALLQKNLSECSGYLRSALLQLNLLRRAADLEPVDSPALLDKLPTSVPEDFGAKVQALIASARPQTDGLAKREELAKQLVENVRSE